MSPLGSTLNSGQVIKLKIFKSRVKSFPIMFGNQEDFVFPLPTNTFAKRIAAYHQTKFHRDIDTVVTQIRKEFWIFSLQRNVSKNYPEKVAMNNLIVIIPSEDNFEDNSLVGSVETRCSIHA